MMKQGAETSLVIRFIIPITGEESKTLPWMFYKAVVHPKPYNYDDGDLLNLEAKFLATYKFLTGLKKEMREVPASYPELRDGYTYEVELTHVEIVEHD